MIDAHANIGDLVYIPSEALLTDYKKFIRTDKPINVLCMGKRDVEVKVFYKGSAWWVNKKSVYPIKEENGS
jgi:hypothetical protein